MTEPAERDSQPGKEPKPYQEALDLIAEELYQQLRRDLDDAYDPDLDDYIREQVKKRVERDLGTEMDLRLARARRRLRAEVERGLKKERKRRKMAAAPERGRSLVRLNRHFRAQHLALFTSVIILIITGLPMKFSHLGISGFVVNLLGGIESDRILHRTGATILIGVALYHLGYTLFHPQGRSDFFLLLPRLKDAWDALLNVLYFLGITRERPRFDRFSYMEKFDYWAVYWGCVIMIGSGLILWFPDTALQWIPKFAVDTVKEAHSDEALLATLALVIWHFYNVHFNPDRFPGTLLWWHGRISEKEIKEEHPLEYERIIPEPSELLPGSADPSPQADAE